MPVKKKTSSQTEKLKKIAAAVVAEDFIRQTQGHQEKTDVVVQLLHEHFENFLVMGYDYNQEPIVVLYNKNPKDKDALGMLMQKFVTMVKFNPPNEDAE
jgi:hypothetical protein